jgi:23S rRNA pseudouridine1911/1915/1917 synthase
VAERVWVVREGDGATVDAIVALAGGDARALDEGRVFVGRRRAKRGDAVSVGDAVRIAAPRGDAVAELTLLHEGGGFVAVDKPAGIPTIPDTHEAEGSLLVRTARAIGARPESLHASSRLDRGVSGVVVFAATPRAREQLQTARKSGRYFRLYAAIAAKAPAPPEGTWSAPIGRARDPRKRAVGGRDATDALTRYRTVAVAGSAAGGKAQTPELPGGAALLAVAPVTGRTHQIRVHASHAGAPLVGDHDYGGPRTVVLPSGQVLATGRIGLHCARVRVNGLLDVGAPVPEALRAWWSVLGGRGDDWLSFDPDGDTTGPWQTSGRS